MELERLMGLVMVLLREKKMTVSKLAAYFEVSKRTIFRDIDRLSLLGVPVACDRGRYGGVFLLEHYKIDKTFLDEQDLTKIILSLNITQKLLENLGVRSTKDKFSFISPDRVRILMNEMDDYVVVDIYDKKIDASDKVWESLAYCLDEWQKAEIHDGTESLVICPISFVIIPHGVHIFAFTDEYKLIALCDICSCRILEEDYVRDFISYEEYKNLK
ncbi:MAG: HTH domain-containing protein [Spirochaetales bacterium]|nr:HTH domain-containing protein [Spirochaetales bacterium]